MSENYEIDGHPSISQIKCPEHPDIPTFRALYLTIGISIGTRKLVIIIILLFLRSINK